MSENIMSNNPYWDHIGLKEVELNEAYSVLELPVFNEITQSRKTVHGGVIASCRCSGWGCPQVTS